MSVRTTEILVCDQVTYLGRQATVMHGYYGSDPWLPVEGQRREPTVNIRFNQPVAGMSRQLDVLVSSLLPVECENCGGPMTTCPDHPGNPVCGACGYHDQPIR